MQGVEDAGNIHLHVPNLLYAKSDEVIGYGLSLLRRSIVLHEEQKRHRAGA